MDVLLVERGLAESREKARALIMAGLVAVDQGKATKPGALFSDTASIAVKEAPKFVGKGGVKLAVALDDFNIDPRGAVVVDVGASTGGFTDCLLQRGASRVYAVDVGYGQLAYSLRTDPRVVVMEKVNARHGFSLPEPVDLATADVSFISLKMIVPNLAPLLRKPGRLVLLFKPQFEVGKGKVGKGGVVRDPALHAQALGDFLLWAVAQRYRLQGLVPSPLLGDAGNREFFIYLKVE